MGDFVRIRRTVKKTPNRGGFSLTGICHTCREKILALKCFFLPPFVRKSLIVMPNIFVAIVLLFTTPVLANVGITALVNGEVITTTELANHAKLVRAVSEKSKSKAPDALENLLENRLKIQEAAKFNITATEPEIRDAKARFRRHMDIDTDAKFKAFVEKNGGDEALRNLLEAEVVWGKVIWQVLRGYVNVSDSEVSGTFGSWEYLLLPGGEGDCAQASPIPSASLRAEFLAKLQGAAVGDIVSESGTKFKVCGRRQLIVDLSSAAVSRARMDILSEKLEAYSVRYLRRLRDNALVEKK